jgi:hypothetical protein
MFNPINLFWYSINYFSSLKNYRSRQLMFLIDDFSNLDLSLVSNVTGDNNLRRNFPPIEFQILSLSYFLNILFRFLLY